MKKTALVCTLSLALLLSLSACHKPQQPDNSAATSTQADVSTPEADNAPAPEPPKAPAPAQLSDAMPAAPAENEDPQEQAEPAAQEQAPQEPVAQEPAAQEPVSEPVQPETPPVTAENPPAETTPTEPAQEQQPAEQPQQQAPDKTDVQKAIQDWVEPSQKNAEQKQEEVKPSGGGTTLEDILAANPGAYVSENGNLILPWQKEYDHVQLQ